VDYLSGMWSSGSSNLQRIPADEIIHGFVTEGAGQVRGFPDACGALLALHMLDKYSEAEVTAARLAACKMGAYEQDSPDAAATLGDSKDGKDLVSEAEPGTFQLLPPGVHFTEFDPKHPTANYAAFVKVQLREVAAGLRLSYNDFSNDLEGVNFSSIRSGTITERESHMMQQNWLIDHLCRPVFESWLEMYLLSGLSALPMGKYDKFASPNWLPRRWQWVDPLKDAEANKLMRAQGWKSDSQIVGEQGNDLDEIQEQILADEEARFPIALQSDALNIDRIAAATEKIDTSGVPALHWAHIVTIGGATSAPGAYLGAASGATTAADTVDNTNNNEGK
jgi:lambda family phage portal protein